MNFEYTAKNIAGPGADPAHFVEDLHGCECKQECTAAAGCACLRASKDNYDKEGRLLHPIGNTVPMFECNDNCVCALNERPCGNRIVQLGVQRKLEVATTPAKGFGVIAKEDIKAGQFLVEYTGEIISKTEAVRRSAERNSPNEHNYIFTVNEFINGKCQPTFIDAHRKGNLARFINHSCEPNLHPQVLRIGCVAPKLTLFASRDIRQGEELSYSYGIVNETAKKDGKKCYCEAKSCFGVLPSAEF